MQEQNTISVSINQKQARAFAAAVFADIRAYKETHLEEYAKFLQQEQAKGKTKYDRNEKTIFLFRQK